MKDLKMLQTHRIVAAGIDEDGFSCLLPFNVFAGDAMPSVCSCCSTPIQIGPNELAAAEAARMGLQTDSIHLFTKNDPVPGGFWELFDWTNAPSLTSHENIN